MSTLSTTPALSSLPIRPWTDADALIKRLANTWRGTLLTMQSDSQDLTAPDTSSMLQIDINERLSPLIRAKSTEEQRQILEGAEEYLLCFLQSKFVVTNIDRNGFLDLLELSVQSSVNPKSLEDVEIRIGFGSAPTEAPNARVPAYILAAKSILGAIEKVQSLKDPDTKPSLPRVLLYSASHFVEAINDGDSEKTLSAAQENFKFIRKYLDSFCPASVAERFSFDEDRAVNRGESLNVLISYYAQGLEEATDSYACDARDRVIGMGMKYGSSREDASRYASAHTIYAADTVSSPDESILIGSQSRPKKLVMIGGEPEKTFWRVRETVKEGASIKGGIAFIRKRIEQNGCSLDGEGYQKLLERYEQYSEGEEIEFLRAQLISQAGKMPVYGMYQGDWSIRDVAEKSFEDLLDAPFDLRMKRDLFAVLCDIADLPQEKAYSFKKKKPFDTETKEKLEEAYLKYSTFCSDAYFMILFQFFL